MRSRARLAVLLALCGATGALAQVQGQTQIIKPRPTGGYTLPALAIPPLNPVSTRPIPETWDDIPPPTRIRLEREVTPLSPQSRLAVVQALKPDTAARAVDQGQLVALQTVRPAPGVTLRAAAGDKGRYGAAGQVLWPVTTAQGAYYCGRAAATAAEPYPAVHCFADRDGDGRFEILTRNDAGPDATVAGSRFMIAGLGDPETLAAPVPYQASGAIADAVEQVGLRYDGPVHGRIVDGKVVDGVAMFRLVVGPAPDRLTASRAFTVTLDALGRGTLVQAEGYRLEVSDVTVDGTAEIRLVRGLPQGETLLFPPVTRDSLLKALRLSLGAPD